jgi:hypothetical protein
MDGQDKCDAVRDTISVSHPHIVCLQESKLDSPDAFKCKSFLPAYLSAFAFSPADGSRGGIITAWNPDTVTGTNVSRSDH